MGRKTPPAAGPVVSSRRLGRLGKGERCTKSGLLSRRDCNCKSSSIGSAPQSNDKVVLELCSWGKRQAGGSDSYCRCAQQRPSCIETRFGAKAEVEKRDFDTPGLYPPCSAQTWAGEGRLWRQVSAGSTSLRWSQTATFLGIFLPCRDLKLERCWRLERRRCLRYEYEQTTVLLDIMYQK